MIKTERNGIQLSLKPKDISLELLEQFHDARSLQEFSRLLWKIFLTRYNINDVSFFLYQGKDQPAIDLRNNCPSTYIDNHPDILKPLRHLEYNVKALLRELLNQSIKVGHNVRTVLNYGLSYTYVGLPGNRLVILAHEEAAELSKLPYAEIRWVLGLWLDYRERFYAQSYVNKIAEIRTVGDELGKNHDLKSLLYKILKVATGLVEAQRGHVMTYNSEKDELEIKSVIGMRSAQVDELINSGLMPLAGVKPGSGVQGEVFLSRTPILDTRLKNDQDPADLEGEWSSILCVPLCISNEVIGVLYVTNKNDNLAFTQEDLNIISILAANVSALIDQAKLKELAITDPLTKLFTRRHFEPKLIEEVTRAKRYDRHVSILALDADFFKKVNDTYGHSAGDAVLIHIAQTMQNNLRKGIDVPARLGGEEFVILLPETDLAGARIVAERILDNIRMSSVLFDDFEIRLTLSIGISSTEISGFYSQDLMKHADEALYLSKENGRDRCTIYGEINAN